MSLEPLYPTLPDSHYAAIGKVAANWSAFERLVESSLCLIALPRLRGGEELATKINNLAKSRTPINSKRNRVVHDTWHWEFKTQRALSLEISAKRRLSYGFTAMSESAINQIVDEIADHINAFDALAREIFSCISPW